jgi:putative ABC transport system permease protein
MARRLLRVWLLAYPPSLRHSYGSEMADAVEQQWRNGRTFMSRVRLAGQLLTDSAASWRGKRRPSFKMRNTSSDLKDAFRLFRRSPRFTISAVAILAAGIGASTAIFSLADATLLRPLPIPDVSRVAATTFSWSYPDFQDVLDHQTMLSDVAGWAYPPLGIERNGSTLAVTGAGVSGHYFSLAGQHALMGRLLNTADDAPGVAPAAVLSERLWRREFGGDPAILGSTINVNRRPVTIVGIVPAAFRGFSLQIAPEFFISLRSVPEFTNSPQEAQAFITNRGRAWFNFAGRMNAGVTQAAADQQLRQIYYRQRPNPDPANFSDTTPWLSPLLDRAIGVAPPLRGRPAPTGPRDLRRLVWVLLAATFAALLLTSATVANLFLMRAERRQREFAIRGAIGAGRGRLIRLLAVESLGIGLLGGLASLGVARLTLNLLNTYSLPGQIAIADLNVTINGEMLAAGTALGVLTTLIFGIVPARRFGRNGDSQLLGVGGRSTVRHSVRSMLIAIQVALCVLLMGGSIAFGRAIRHAVAVDLGFNTSDTLIAAINPTLLRTAPDRVRAFQRESLSRISATSGVRAAGWGAIRPMSGTMILSPVIDGYARAKDEDISMQSNVVGPGYFDALQMPIERGRAFGESDTPQSERAVIVSAAAAKRFWPSGNALGGRISLEDAGAADPKWMTVVGISGDIHRAIGEPAPPLMYLPSSQTSGPFSVTNYLFIRVDRDAADLAPTLRATLASIDPAVVVTGVATMASHVGATLKAHRLGLTLFALFAAVSALLTGFGLYAVVGAAVSMRAREIGIRVALGAERASVVRLVLRQAAVPIVAGLAAGLAGFVAAAQFLNQFMFSLPVVSPAVMTLIAAAIGGIACAALFVPARRALAVDPAITLRTE